MDEPVWEWLPRAVWRWRWRRHLAWLRREAVHAQEKTFRLARPGGAGVGGSGRPGAALGARLRELERLEAEMRVLIHDD